MKIPFEKQFAGVSGALLQGAASANQKLRNSAAMTLYGTMIEIVHYEA